MYRPIAKVSFQSPHSDTLWVDTWLIVDSGADFSILPRYHAHDLGINLEKDCVIDATQGVGGQQTIYLCKKKISVKIGTIERKIPLAFFDSDELPALLGRLGFLETFDVSFQKTHKVTFKN